MNYITIPGFEALTPQQLFDMALTHIRTTRTRSTRQHESGGPISCSYTGSGCAASVFIREEERERADSCGDEPIGAPWVALFHKNMVPDHHVILISRLQRCHDNTPNDEGFMDCFEQNMKNAARDHALIYREPTLTFEPNTSPEA